MLRDELVRQSRLVRYQTIDPEIEQPLHIFGLVYRPGINLLSAPLRPNDETAIRSGLLDAQEIHIQSRGLTCVK